MKPRNQFEHLSSEDRKKIIELCDQHPYADVAQILTQPRSEGGLAILTSIPALCRFYTQYQENTSIALLANQFGHALQLRRQAAPGACLTGILALFEHRILESLKKGRPLSDLSTEIRLLKMVHTTFIADERERRENVHHDKTYRKYIESQSKAPAADFKRTDIKNDPGAKGIDPFDFEDEMSQENEDICAFQLAAQKERHKLEQARKLKASLLAEAAQTQSSAPTPLPAAAHLPAAPAAPSAKPAPGDIYLPPSNPFVDQLVDSTLAKKPAIPHFPLNSTKPQSPARPGPATPTPSPAKQPKAAA